MRLMLLGLLIVVLSWAAPADRATEGSGASSDGGSGSQRSHSGPSGANDWSCRPTKARPTPIVLVHGTFGDKNALLDDLSAAIKSRGYCVFALNYGDRGTARIPASAKELRRYVTRVRTVAEAPKVSIVGLSQGGLMSRFYTKFLGGTGHVDDLVGLVPPNHGTRLAPDPDDPSTAPFFHPSCKACKQMRTGSEFLRRLNAGDETPGSVSYTQITTRHDQVVIPHRSGYLQKGPRTTNVTIQRLCPADPADHYSASASKNIIAVTLHALAHRGSADPRFQPACAQ